MYDEIVSRLQERGIRFDVGLRSQEIEMIQQKYDILFPEFLKIVLSKRIAVSEGFYNWRKDSRENVSYIKSAMEKPFKDMMECCDELEWCEKWGEEPASPRKRKLALQNMVRGAPQAYTDIFTPLYGQCSNT